MRVLIALTWTAITIFSFIVIIFVLEVVKKIFGETPVAVVSIFIIVAYFFFVFYSKEKE